MLLNSNMTSNAQTSGSSQNIRGLICNAGSGAAAGNFFVFRFLVFLASRLSYFEFILMGFSQNFHFSFQITVSGHFSFDSQMFSRMASLTL